MALGISLVMGALLYRYQYLLYAPQDSVTEFLVSTITPDTVSEVPEPTPSRIQTSPEPARDAQSPVTASDSASAGNVASALTIGILETTTIPTSISENNAVLPDPQDTPASPEAPTEHTGSPAPYPPPATATFTPADSPNSGTFKVEAELYIPLILNAFIPQNAGSDTTLEGQSTPITPTLGGQSIPITSTLAEQSTPITTTLESLITPTVAPLHPPEPIARLKIPKLKVERAVVDIGMVGNKKTGQDWDTDSLFATRKRKDLVGHLEGSALPGEGSNIILVGHNYDWGIYQWNGVFHDLKKLRKGNQIILYTKDGEEHVYEVETVKEIPFSSGSQKELERHLNFLMPSESERLTLVSCGGANFWLWNKRVYVIATPEDQ